jgi:hypothetical protein
MKVISHNSGKIFNFAHFCILEKSGIWRLLPIRKCQDFVVFIQPRLVSSNPLDNLDFTAPEFRYLANILGSRGINWTIWISQLLSSGTFLTSWEVAELIGQSDN